MEQAKVPPVKQGDRVKAVCESTGTKGDKLFRHKGYVIFVKDNDVSHGQACQLEITKVTAKVGFARVINDA